MKLARNSVLVRGGVGKAHRSTKKEKTKKQKTANKRSPTQKCFCEKDRKGVRGHERVGESVSKRLLHWRAPHANEKEKGGTHLARLKWRNGRSKGKKAREGKKGGENVVPNDPVPNP